MFFSVNLTDLQKICLKNLTKYFFVVYLSIYKPKRRHYYEIYEDKKTNYETHNQSD